MRIVKNINPMKSKLIFHYCRTIIALGHLVMSCDQTLYVKLINILMEELENPQGQTQNIRTYIQVNKFLLMITILLTIILT